VLRLVLCTQLRSNLVTVGGSVRMPRGIATAEKILYLDAAPLHLWGAGQYLDEPSETMNRLGIIREFWEFLRERKRWWLAPILFFLVLLGAMLVFAKGSALAPFIYSLF